MHADHSRKVSNLFNAYKISSFVRIGEPKDEIIKMAEEIKPDLLILGTRGMGLIKRLLLGSVSEYCIHHSNYPILLIPDKTQ